MNQFMLGVGFMCMCFGCAVMIYMEITSETSEDETSDAIKKIILNFFTIDLAGGWFAIAMAHIGGNHV